MMLLWIASLFLGSVCMAQNNVFTRVAGSTQTGVGSFPNNGLSSGVSSIAAGGSLAGPSGSSAYAQASTKIQPPPQPYPLCLKNKPDDAVVSGSPFTYSLLEASFTNPDLKGFYNTSFDTRNFYNAIFDQLKETWPHHRSQSLAGAMSLMFEVAYPKTTPLLNAVAISEAIGKFLGLQTIVISDEKEDYIETFLSAISKAVSDADGSAPSQTVAVARGLLKYLDDVQQLSYLKLHEFTSILAGQYYLVIHSTCKPTNFQDIPTL